MISIEWLRQQMMAFRHGKLALAVRVANFVVGAMVILYILPWLAAEDISHLSEHENPTSTPPEWAKSFSVAHGRFIYYPDSRSSNPMRAASVAALLCALFLLDYGIATWLNRRMHSERSSTEQTGPGQPATRPESKAP